MRGPESSCRRVRNRSCLVGTVVVALALASCGKTATISLLPLPNPAVGQVNRDAGGDGGGGACKSDRVCPPATSHCDPIGGVCVECVADSDCSTGVCDPGTHACGGCNVNSDCGPEAPTCDLDVHTCVECEASFQCPAGQVCAFESHRCAPACQTSRDCAGNGRPICATASRVCVECIQDSDCVGLGQSPRCYLLNGSCVECLSDRDCDAGRCQLIEHLCVECLTSSDCDGRPCTHYQCGG
jgi:Cys-rich repeat protein